MSDLLPTIASYISPSLTRKILTDPSASEKFFEEEFPAAVMFADISGFTPLTEALSEKGTEGSEELTRLLNQTFSKIIAIIEAQGGEVVKFAGDAITVIFPAEYESLEYATRRAFQAAAGIQEVMESEGKINSSVGKVTLALKVGIGAGQIKTMHIGGKLNRWEYVIAGDPVRQFAEAEKKAQKGDIVLSPEAERIIFSNPIYPQPLQVTRWDQMENAAGFEEIMARCIPHIVYGWITQGLKDWLAVLRPMTVFFAGIGGIDYLSEDAGRKLNIFFNKTQDLIYQFEGSINKLAVDDKGTVILALFGAPPLAHGDDPLRAIKCALELQKIAVGENLRLAIGITTGWVFAGPVGGETRREYTVMGDTVNTAARLMGAAGEGGILCDQNTQRSASSQINFNKLDPINLKGKSEKQQIFTPVDFVNEPKSLVQKSLSALIGRETEFEKLQSILDKVFLPASQLLILKGETGIGKSRLLAELLNSIDKRGLNKHIGEGQSIEQFTPYRAWRPIISSLFGIENIQDLMERRQTVISLVNQIAPDQIERLPLLNDIIELGLPDTDLTASLDPDLHKQSLGLLVVSLLKAKAQQAPLILVFEDAHWLDSVSWDLITLAARSLSNSNDSVLMIISTRPMFENPNDYHLEALEKLTISQKLVLGPLGPDKISQVANARLGLPEDGLPDSLKNLVIERADGSPFFAEEFALTLRDQGLITIIPDPKLIGSPFPNQCIVNEGIEFGAQQLPDTVQGLILSRIDRLSPERQLVLKIGAVIGRSFKLSPLNHALEIHTTITSIASKYHLDALNSLDLTELADLEPDLNFIFKHVSTQEVAYQTLLFSQRRELHKTIAEWYENEFGNKDISLAPYYPLLAHHYHLAEIREKELFFAKLAGEQAAAQFANETAIKYLSQALDLTPEKDLDSRFELYSLREKIHDLLGQRELQQADLLHLEEITQQFNEPTKTAQIALKKAGLAEATGKFSDVIYTAQEVVNLAETHQLQNLEAEGYLKWGVALWRLGNLEEAQIMMENSLQKSIEVSQIRAHSLRYLGIVQFILGNPDQSKITFQNALTLYQKLNDLRGVSQSSNNLGNIYRHQGDYNQTIYFYNYALENFQKIGDRRGESIALNNLGRTHLGLGNYPEAKKFFERVSDLYQEIGDLQGLSVTANNLALLLNNMGEHEKAANSAEKAIQIARSIGDLEQQGYAFTNLGHAQTMLSNLREAKVSFEKSIEIWKTTKQTKLETEPLAGLGQVENLLGNKSEALIIVDKIFPYIENNELEGVEEPFRVMMTCFSVLKANDDPRAERLLKQMYEGLKEKTQKITDKNLQSSFVKNVKIHNNILKAWEKEHGKSSEILNI